MQPIQSVSQSVIYSMFLTLTSIDSQFASLVSHSPLTCSVSHHYRISLPSHDSQSPLVRHSVNPHSTVGILHSAEPVSPHSTISQVPGFSSRHHQPGSRYHQIRDRNSSFHHLKHSRIFSQQSSNNSLPTTPPPIKKIDKNGNAIWGLYQPAMERTFPSQSDLVWVERWGERALSTFMELPGDSSYSPPGIVRTDANHTLELISHVL